MKQRAIASGIVALICLLLARMQEHPWKGHIKTVNGIPHVMNPRDPIHGEDIIELKEEYRIHPTDAHTNYLLNNPSRMVVDGSGNLYVLDPREGNAKIFDEQGQYVGTIGNKGEGPGELDVPSSIGLYDDKKIMILDMGNNRLSFYNQKGNYDRSIPTSGLRILDMASDANGYLYCIVQTRMADYFRYDLQQFDSSLRYLRTFRSDDDHAAVKPSLFLANPSLAVYGGQILYGCPDRGYEFDVFNNDGRVIRKISKDFTREKIPAVEREDALSKIPGGLEVYIPEYYPPYLDISVDDNGRVIVYSRQHSQAKMSTFDIFTPKGLYLAALNIRNLIKPASCIWRKNRLYAMEYDSDGLPIVVVYGIKWKL